MDKNLAEKLMATLNAASDKLNEAAAVVEMISDHDEKRRFKASIAELMADVYIKLMKPIIREHKDMDPDRDIA